MSIELNKALVRRHYEEVLTGKNVAVIDELYAPVIGLTSDASMDREQFKAVAGMMHAAFPDVVVTVQDQIAEGDKVVTRWTAQATHQGDFGEKPMGFSLRKLPGAKRRGASRASRPRASG